MTAFKKAVACLSSVALVWTLTPTAGLAYASDGDDMVIVHDRTSSEVAENVEYEADAAQEDDPDGTWRLDVIFRDESEIEEAEEPEVAPEEPEDALIPQSTEATGPATGVFSDVPDDHWAKGVIECAASLGIMAGYSGSRAGQFGPEDSISRAQAATTLWRMAGKPAVTATTRFPDVAENAYYASAIAWAANVGIINGYSTGDKAGMFGPDDPVKREELAAMLHNYAKKIIGFSAPGTASSYAAMSDASSVSSWAMSAVGWCFGAGILTGSGSYIYPQRGTRRSEAAKMFIALYVRSTSPWQLTVKGSTTRARRGSQASVIPTLYGNSAGVTLSYDVKIGSETTSLASGDMTLSKVGRYFFTVTARGTRGASQKASTSIISYAGPQSLTASRTSAGNAWKLDADLGFGKGVGVDGVELRFTWKRGNASGTVKDWSSSATATLSATSMGNSEGTCEVVVEARDSAGLLGTASTKISSNASGDSTLDSYVSNIVSKVGTGDGALKKAYQYIANNYRYGWGSTYPQGNWQSWSKTFAKEMYSRGWGNCYRYASLMTWVAIRLGYEARTVSGQCLSGGGWTAHGWCEVRVNGTWYVIDCTMRNAHQDRDFFMKTFSNAPLYYRYL